MNAYRQILNKVIFLEAAPGPWTVAKIGSRLKLNYEMMLGSSKSLVHLNPDYQFDDMVMRLELKTKNRMSWV